ncbi:MarR family winged helix-turn-helix transcriptional regulator [Bdellovibrio svalbardensis]|uniref:MarR family transcriptional regulator n=1 Tax=Bdellovibrio svalbardensis TaxID=2972972 RepID=A0ABT6DFL7_9BACT|nr:MarR family transcriptional regulator [Bdellovibrio svalbardensis]MDG0815635.1 MarR family transcriptional regulator [Bdellovibrio svalbardensis]
MAKLFIQELPSREEIHKTASELHAGVEMDAWVLHSNLLFMKVATELEMKLDSLLSEYQLSSGRFTLLFILRNSPEGLMPSVLAQKVGVTQATISGLLNSLEKANLIVRETHQRDGRSFVIKLTEKGDSTIKEIFPRWYPFIQSFWGQFADDEKSNLDRLLERMIHTTTLQKAEQ